MVCRERGIKVPKAPSIINWKHEFDCGNLYTSLWLTGLLDAWWYDQIMESGVKPDRVSHFKGKLIFWEVDRGTEIHSKVESKLPMYLDLYRQRPDQVFYVIFTAPTKKRAKNILMDDLLPVNRGFRFLVALHDDVLNTPLNPIFVSPKQPDSYLSIDDLM
jgi:hypothetical protein